MKVIEAIPIRDFKHKLQLTKHYDKKRREYHRIEVIGDILYLERTEIYDNKRKKR